MKQLEFILAKKYAQAYGAVFGEQFSPAICDALLQYATFLKQHPSARFYLKLSSLAQEKKIEALLHLADTYELRSFLEPLLHLLAQHHRLELLVPVLKALITQYKKTNHIVDFTVEVATTDPVSLDRIQQFLHQQTGVQAALTVKHNPALLAGIKMWSSDLLWEHSIRQQLRRLRAAYYHE